MEYRQSLDEMPLQQLVGTIHNLQTGAYLFARKLFGAKEAVSDLDGSTAIVSLDFQYTIRKRKAWICLALPAELPSVGLNSRLVRLILFMDVSKLPHPSEAEPQTTAKESEADRISPALCRVRAEQAPDDGCPIQAVAGRREGRET